MADVRPGGVKAVHYSTTGAGGSWTQINGEIESVDGMGPEVIEQAHTSGNYQSGETSAPSFLFLDFTDYDTLRALAVGGSRAKRFFAVEYFDGTIYKTSVAVYPKVVLTPKGARDEGDSGWTLSWNHSADTMLTKISSLS